MKYAVNVMLFLFWDYNHAAYIFFGIAPVTQEQLTHYLLVLIQIVLEW